MRLNWYILRTELLRCIWYGYIEGETVSKQEVCEKEKISMFMLFSIQFPSDRS